MWPKEEAPFIRSLLDFSSNLAEANYHDVVSDSECGFTSGWGNVRPQAIYQANRSNGRRKIKALSSSGTRTRQNVHSKSTKITPVMRGTLDDKWNYHYPNGNRDGNTETARDDKTQEITEDVVKEREGNAPWAQGVHVQKLREAIVALVKKDQVSSEVTEQVGVPSHPSDKIAYSRWAAKKQPGVVLPKEKERRVTTIPHQMNKISFDYIDPSQLLNVRQLPVGANQTVRRHKVLDPTIRYELSQLVQSQLYGQLIVEQQSVNDQLLKVSSALLLPSSADHQSELQGSRSYPNISTNGRNNYSFNNNTTATLHKFSLARKF